MSRRRDRAPSNIQRFDNPSFPSACDYLAILYYELLYQCRISIAKKESNLQKKRTTPIMIFDNVEFNWNHTYVLCRHSDWRTRHHPGGSSTLRLGWLHKCGRHYHCIGIDRSYFGWRYYAVEIGLMRKSRIIGRWRSKFRLSCLIFRSKFQLSGRYFDICNEMSETEQSVIKLILFFNRNW
jgi:hypothetical protein